MLLMSIILLLLAELLFLLPLLAAIAPQPAILNVRF